MSICHFAVYILRCVCVMSWRTLVSQPDRPLISLMTCHGFLQEVDASSSGRVFTHIFKVLATSALSVKRLEGYVTQHWVMGRK